MKIDCIGGHNLRVSICEGKKNEVRIVLAACGCPVHKLHRVSFGNIKLKKLPVGKILPVPQKTIDEMLKSL
jgi:16S rRNA U516 pseudouridylate synthase RsuA-like enzyme